MKKILIDILHPAHVHFFRNAITDLGAAGHQVLITSRNKDITHRLLDLYGLEYTTLSSEAPSKAGLARELIFRNAKLFRLLRRERPDVLASIGGTSTAQVGFIARTRNLIFYDTENAALSNLISYPFASKIITPDCYKGRVPRKKHIRYAGYHELAYLHPNRFSPDPEVLWTHGVDPNESFSVVRFVSWKALHDLKARGFSLDAKLRLAITLKKYGRVFITSEEPLSEELEEYRLPLAPHQVHHLLSFARLFIGESATMASESAMLGTPFVYIDAVGRGYTDEQERRYGLGYNFRPTQIAQSMEKAADILSANLKETALFRESWARMLREKIDVTSFVVARILDPTLP